MPELAGMVETPILPDFHYSAVGFSEQWFVALY